MNIYLLMVTDINFPLSPPAIYVGKTKGAALRKLIHFELGEGYWTEGQFDIDPHWTGESLRSQFPSYRFTFFVEEV